MVILEIKISIRIVFPTSMKREERKRKEKKKKKKEREREEGRKEGRKDRRKKTKVVSRQCLSPQCIFLMMFSNSTRKSYIYSFSC